VSELFDEVDEEVRREQFKKLWDKYSIYFIALMVLIVAAVGGWRGYQYFEAKKAAEAGAAFEKAVELSEQGKHAEAETAFAEMDHDSRRRARQQLSKPLWGEFEVWLKLQRTLVLDGSKIAEAIDYSLNAWKALTLHLDDGAVAVDNNLIERQIKPWKLGAKNWLFVGSELAGQRAAVVMSLVQSAKLNGLDPWAYLRDVLARIHSHPSHRLDELLPHRWRPD